MSISKASLDFHQTLADAYFHPPGAGFWSIPLVLAVIGLVLLWRQDRNRTLLLTVLAFLPLILLAFGLPPPFDELSKRSLYLVHISLWLLVGVTLSWLVQNLPPVRLPHWLPKATAITLIAVLLPIEIVYSQDYLRENLDYYDYLDNTHCQAIEWIAQNTESEAIIIAYPEAFGRWIKAEAKRNAFELTDRNQEQYTYLREESLIADRILSRNQGLENGTLRLAMTYPYDSSGDLVLGVSVGGKYQDVLMLNDHENYFEVEGGDNTSLADAHKEMIIKLDDESGQAATLYQADSLKVIQTAILNQGEQAVTIFYQVKSDNAKVTEFNIPVLFCQQPESVSIDKPSFEVTQELKTLFDGIVTVTTQVTIYAEGACLQKMNPLEQQVGLSFDIENKEATITLNFSLITPQLQSDAPVEHYEVPQLIKEYEVNYIAVDSRPESSLWGDIPWGTEEWLDNCPYYKFVYPVGDIRIYRVDTSALP